jgi:hypothetical protein
MRCIGVRARPNRNRGTRSIRICCACGGTAERHCCDWPRSRRRPAAITWHVGESFDVSWATCPRAHRRVSDGGVLASRAGNGAGVVAGEMRSSLTVRPEPGHASDLVGGLARKRRLLLSMPRSRRAQQGTMCSARDRPLPRTRPSVVLPPTHWRIIAETAEAEFSHRLDPNRTSEKSVQNVALGHFSNTGPHCC